MTGNQKPMPAGEYEIRLFFHNEYGADATVRASYGFSVSGDAFKTIKAQYAPNETVSVLVNVPLSGEKDWVGVFPKNASNAWGNVIAWNWVEQGNTVLSRDQKPMPAGEYEVRLFFHNSFNLEEKVSFSVTDNNENDAVFGARPVKATPISQGKLFASPNGNGEDCSEAAPCNIHTGISKLSQTKNILFLLKGTYNLTKRIYFGQIKGTESKPLIIESIDPNNKAVLTGIFNNIALIMLYQSEYIQLKNLEIKEFDGFGIRLKEASNIKIEGCIIHDNNKSGISLYRSSHNNIIIDNIVFKNIDNKGNADGIQIQGPASSSWNKIIHNTVYGNSDDGIDIFGGLDTIVTYNISYDNLALEGPNGGQGNGAGIKACSDTSRGSIIKHNIAFNNKGHGIECHNNIGEDVVFKYNTTYNNNSSGFGLHKNSKVKLSYNISSNHDVSQSLDGIQSNNSWDISDDVPFVNTDEKLKDFLRPKEGSGFEEMGAYAKSNNKDIRIFVIGDSTVHNQEGEKLNGSYLEMGWANRDALGSYMINASNLYNEARSGASSKSYKIVDTNRHDWEETKNLIKSKDISEGAYLLIQFGHNDEHIEHAGGTYPRYEGADSFYKELETYVDWAKNNAVIPVLITPVERRGKSEGNNNHKTHIVNDGDYAQIVRNLAEDKNVLLLDLQNKSWNEYNTYKNTAEINQVLAYDDNTHFSPKGAKIVAGWVKDLACDLDDDILCKQFK